MQNLLNTLGINETYTKQIKKPTKFNHIRDNIPLKKNFNFMADLIELPVTKKKFKYLLVCVDLATDEFDVEPMKDKDAKTVLKIITNHVQTQLYKKT